MDKLRDYRTNSTRWQRCLITLPVIDESAITNPGRTQENKALMRRSFLLATLVTALALLPLSFYGLVGAQDDDSINSSSVQVSADEEEIQFNLVPASDAIANCFPDATAKVRVSLTAKEEETDTFILTAKKLRPNTTFAVFLTELPGAPFGAVQFLANLKTNANGKGSVEVKAIIKDAFISQVIDGQRVRKELNHVVFWFADPADADECFAPGTAPVTSFDADGVAGPSAMSSRNILPGSPLP